jgi:hypothetical protein
MSQFPTPHMQPRLGPTQPLTPPTGGIEPMPIGMSPSPIPQGPNRGPAPLPPAPMGGSPLPGSGGGGGFPMGSTMHQSPQMYPGMNRGGQQPQGHAYGIAGGPPPQMNGRARLAPRGSDIYAQALQRVLG